MNRIKEVLSRIRKGTTINALTEELNMNESLLRAIIEFSVDSEYLKEINTQYNCVNYLWSPKCSTEDCKSPSKMYALTAKGLGFISPDSKR